VIDLHCHVLPGIDDGPSTVEDSLLLVRAAASAGIDTIVATPHVSRDYPNDGRMITQLVSDLRARITAEELALTLWSGAEIAVTMLDRIEPPGLQTLTLGDGPWLLIECPFTSMASGFDVALLRLQSQGYRIVLAHPERSPVFHRDPKLLGALAGTGILCSITTGSLTGSFGGQVQRFALRLAGEGLIHNVTSDAHSHEGRAPGITGGLKQAGLEGLSTWLTRDVPEAILAGDEIPARPVSAAQPHASSSWWRRVRRHR
jgi:protein-tyrosine phosphatase